MLLLISDANILIDIDTGGLVAPMFSLDYRFAVPDVLFAEELEEQHSYFLGMGLASKEPCAAIRSAGSAKFKKYFQSDGIKGCQPRLRTGKRPKRLLRSTQCSNNSLTGIKIMKKSLFAAPALAALVLVSGAAFGQPEPAKKSDGVLVTPAGMTLYTFDKDTAGSGKSACNGPCAATWPPLAAAPGAESAAPYSVVKRDDGSAQLAYHGKPLYLYMADKKPGERSGDNVKNVWHVVKD
jgi:predicted lipoprotein with Yx(FWY)xxD motif